MLSREHTLQWLCHWLSQSFRQSLQQPKCVQSDHICASPLKAEKIWFIRINFLIQFNHRQSIKDLEAIRAECTCILWYCWALFYLISEVQLYLYTFVNFVYTVSFVNLINSLNLRVLKNPYLSHFYCFENLLILNKAE